MPWRTKAKLLCLDTETTGLEPGKDRIVELGACLRADGEFRPFRQLVNPGCKIPAEATKVHGITDEAVADKSTLAEISSRVLARVAQADVIVGYNWPFDEAMLRAELPGWELAIAGKPVLDPWVLLRRKQIGAFWKGSGRYKLESAAARMGLRRKGTGHRAASDCELTLQLLLKCGERLCPKHLSEDAQEASEQIARWREQDEIEFQAWLAKQPPREP